MAARSSFSGADARIFMDGREVGQVQPLNITASIDPEYRPSDTYSSRRRMNMWQNLASEIPQAGIFTSKEMTIDLKDAQIDMDRLLEAMGYAPPVRDNEHYAEKKLEQW